jgi:hypothetical protein
VTGVGGGTAGKQNGMQSLLVKACDLRRQGAALEGENAALVRFTLVGVAGCRGYRSVRHSRTVLTTGAGTDGARHENHLSFRDWAVGELNTWTDSVKGTNATAEIRRSLQSPSG